MTDHDAFFQGQQPAAVLKHAVLSEYFNVFVGMVGKGYSGTPLWLIDGYAGPGRYDPVGDLPGVDGSPVIAARMARDWLVRPTPRDIRLVLVEASSRHAESLRLNLEPFLKQGVRATVLQGEAEQQVPAAWRMVGTDPVVTFLDPFGVALSRDLLTQTLLSREKPPSEVLLNINVEAVSRLGGLIERSDDGEVAIKPNCHEKGVERADRFLGGTWWREEFVDARQENGSAAEAARRVVQTYCEQVNRETGASYMAVPIRRSPTGQVLFLLTLFFWHPAAAYKFADAAARASRKWRDAFRSQALADFLQDDEPMLSGLDSFFTQMSETEAAETEKRLKAQWEATVVDNICGLLERRRSIHVGSSIAEVLGTALSLAGESELRRAWDSLADDGMVEKRPSGALWNQYIVRR